MSSQNHMTVFLFPVTWYYMGLLLSIGHFLQRVRKSGFRHFQIVDKVFCIIIFASLITFPYKRRRFRACGRDQGAFRSPPEPLRALSCCNFFRIRSGKFHFFMLMSKNRLFQQFEWLPLLFRGGGFGRPAAVRSCKEWMLQTKSTTQPDAVFHRKSNGREATSATSACASEN